MARTTALKDEHGHPVYANGGAVAQDGPLKLYSCNTCHRDVAWAESTRTGRHYLVNVFHGQAGQRYYVKASAHDCSGEAEAARERDAAKIAELRQAIADMEKLAGLYGETASITHTLDLWRKQLAELEAT